MKAVMMMVRKLLIMMPSHQGTDQQPLDSGVRIIRVITVMMRMIAVKMLVISH